MSKKINLHLRDLRIVGGRGTGAGKETRFNDFDFDDFDPEY